MDGEKERAQFSSEPNVYLPFFANTFPCPCWLVKCALPAFHVWGFDTCPICILVLGLWQIGAGTYILWYCMFNLFANFCPLVGHGSQFSFGQRWSINLSCPLVAHPPTSWFWEPQKTVSLWNQTCRFMDRLDPLWSQNGLTNALWHSSKRLFEQKHRFLHLQEFGAGKGVTTYPLYILPSRLWSFPGIFRTFWGCSRLSCTAYILQIHWFIVRRLV